MAPPSKAERSQSIHVLTCIKGSPEGSVPTQRATHPGFRVTVVVAPEILVGKVNGGAENGCAPAQQASSLPKANPSLRTCMNSLHGQRLLTGLLLGEAAKLRGSASKPEVSRTASGHVKDANTLGSSLAVSFKSKRKSTLGAFDSTPKF